MFIQVFLTPETEILMTITTLYFLVWERKMCTQVTIVQEWLWDISHKDVKKVLWKHSKRISEDFMEKKPHLNQVCNSNNSYDLWANSLPDIYDALDIHHLCYQVILHLKQVLMVTKTLPNGHTPTSSRSTIKKLAYTHKKRKRNWPTQIALPSPQPLHFHFPTLLLINIVSTYLSSGHRKRHEIGEI